MRRYVEVKGYTLIEVLVALVILSISLLGIASLMSSSTRYNAFGGRLTEATTLAQDRLEKFRTTPWANIATGNDTIQGATGITYARAWRVDAIPPPPDDTLKTATVTVNWNDGTNHDIIILSAIAR